ncbi:hypothetical protein [Parachlamydia sp. AcF125]|uniref:hypothetical protein n=1 Tax=Parachlamydia sp. AcF125 TaxID=2795736 RepID=UPI001BC95C2B|nr:hypothetical protein [Parachlamydia sp. AcF125]MBS4169294.1 hypothetical protein [Parachlamydia sp. AcF125]
MQEYRNYFHISQGYGVSEGGAYKTIKWVEDRLIKDPDFTLPGRKALLKRNIEYEVALINVKETPIVRPKNVKAFLFRQKEKAQKAPIKIGLELRM